MASSSKNNKGLLLFRADTPHFFKMFHGSSVNQHKLAIPRKFVRFYGHHLPSHRVMLKVPTGAKWQVEIVKSAEGEIWLQNGWREFAEYYSVVDGSMLVFDYEKSASEFNVIIFDKSTTEITYPFERANFDVDQEQLVPEDQPSKANNPDEQFQKLKTCSRTSNQNAQAEDPGRQRVNRSIFTRKKALSRAEKAKTIHKAISNFRSLNPSFNILMQPSYVHGNNCVLIPSSFAKKYLKKNGGDAILNHLDGRSWSIKYYSSITCGTASTRFSNSGWNKFLKDNHLQVGDVCIFELLEYIDEAILRVTISKWTDLHTSPGNNSKQSKHQESCSKEPKLSSDFPKRPRLPSTCSVSNENHTRKKIKLHHSVETLNRDYPKRKEVEEGSKKTKASEEKTKATGRPRSNFISGNPTYKREMKPLNFYSTNKYSLRVPRSFVKNMEQRSHKAKLQVENKLWSVKLNVYPHVGIFGEGWLEFARQNSLEVGDVCTFELIDTEILLISVSIARDVS